MGSIKAVAFDLDGTIYMGEKLVDGVPETLNHLRKNNIKVFYFTNNSGKSRKDIHQKLQRLNLSSEIETVYNSAYATGVYLKQNHFKKVYCCGSAGLKEEIALAGIRCVGEKESPEAVVVGLDHSFDYAKMTIALNLLKNKDCRFIACNKDRYYPVENFRLMPGCGAIVAAIEAAADRQTDVVIGKPNVFMLDLLCGDWSLQNKDILVVGDSFESDIAMADSYGSPSLLLDINDVFSVKTRKIRSITEIKNYV